MKINNEIVCILLFLYCFLNLLYILYLQYISLYISPISHAHLTHVASGCLLDSTAVGYTSSLGLHVRIY